MNKLKVPFKQIGLVSLAIVILLMFPVGILLIGYQLPLILPSPIGSYQVGRVEYDWIDENRVDPLSDQSAVHRELPIWIWYPADVNADSTTAPYLPPAWEEAYNELQGLNRFQERNVESIRTHSFENAALAGSHDPYPVLILMPGYGLVPADYTVMAENLASNGYVVIGINPTYASTLVVSSEGKVFLQSDKGSLNQETFDADLDRIGRTWRDDALFVLDRVEEMNKDGSSLFFNKLDMQMIGLLGHSFGGATAAAVCKTDPRCKAGVDIDGALNGFQAEGTLQSPFMFLVNETCEQGCETNYNAFVSSQNDGYYFSILGSRHYNFSDLPLRMLLPLRSKYSREDYIGSISPQRALQVSDAYLVAFFNRYLMGIESDLLQKRSSLYPELVFKVNQDE